MALPNSLAATLSMFPPAPTVSTCKDLRKIAKRLLAVDLIKDGPDYGDCVAVAPQLMPPEPDPCRYPWRHMSKRTWEQVCTRWRHELALLRIELTEQGML